MTVFALLALFLAAPGCTDLDVTNPNDPDRERALATAGDVESLVSGTFHTYWNAVSWYSGETTWVSASSFQHSCTPANFGCVRYSAFPRPQIANSTADQDYGDMSQTWGQLYSALSSVRDGLRAVNEGEGVAEELGPERVTRLQAYGKFVQGLAHAGVALLHDQGFVVDETQEQGEDPELLGYQELMQRAMGYFDEAISLSQGADFTIPDDWMSQSVDASTLAELAHSMKARYMAAVARTPAEREAVDWNAVLNELDAGLDQTWSIQVTPGNPFDFSGWGAGFQALMGFPGWGQNAYFIHGMADQSGMYQTWLEQPISSRGPNVPHPDGDPFLIQTPDTRYPQGSTVDEQVANPGELMAVPHPDAPCVTAQFRVGGEHFERPSRGVWRWSYYFPTALHGCNFENYGAPWALVMAEELRLLEAEARLRLGQAGAAADLINETRTAHGLNATDASGTNTSCVPRLPDGTCGDLMEMLKWEKRLESVYRGLHSNGWFFDGRGWGDLYSGTYLHLPIPEEDLLLLNMSTYTTGPGAQSGSAAPVSVYEWPGEG